VLDEVAKKLEQHDWFYEMSADVQVQEEGRKSFDELIELLNFAALEDPEGLSKFVEEFTRNTMNVSRYYPPTIKALIHSKYNFLKQFILPNLREDTADEWRGLMEKKTKPDEIITEPLIGTPIESNDVEDRLYKKLTNKQ
jgi:hypothetical protein